MKINRKLITLFVGISCIYSCKLGSKISVSSHPNIIDSIPKITRIIIPRAIGTENKTINQNVSYALEYYLNDYMQIVNQDSLINFYHKNKIYTKVEDYSYILMNEIASEYKCKYFIVPNVKNYIEGMGGRQDYIQAEIVVNYELYDVEKKTLLCSFEAKSNGEVHKINPILNISNQFEASKLESLYKDMSLEVVNKIRNYLKIKHKYDYLLEPHGFKYKDPN